MNAAHATADDFQQAVDFLKKLKEAESYGANGILLTLILDYRYLVRKKLLDDLPVTTVAAWREKYLPNHEEPTL